MAFAFSSADSPLARLACTAVLTLCALFGADGAAAQSATALPAELDAVLTRSGLPRDALSLLVLDAEGKARPRLSHRANVPVNPASVMKLVTTFAALEQLGPAYGWSTPVYIDGTLRDGVLLGNLYIRGRGDPKLVTERLWLMMRRVQGLGIKAIQGDIVLDRSAFDAPEPDPAQFDGEPLRPYNAAPDALLINFKSVVMSFAPMPALNLALVSYEPALAGVAMQASVPLSTGDCGDYRGALKADFSDPKQIRFAGSYAASCGEKVWPVAYADPKSYGVRAVEAAWRALAQDGGGKLSGVVREGLVPATLKPMFEVWSPALSEIIRDINKFSNNVMAQQLFLSLALHGNGGRRVNLEAAREALRKWWKARVPGTEAGVDDMPVFDNGSGLSRNERISANALGRLLQLAWASPYMPEFTASLPLSGIDGTLRRSRAQGMAHLKTGSLRDVAAVAGYVHGASGKRYILIAIANHANAIAARPLFEALIDWTARDGAP